MAESWFLKIDGIQGESTDVSHKDEVDVLSWSWGVSRPGGGGTGSGAGAGKASFQDFQFMVRISKASPVLFLSCATGTHIKEALLSGVRTAAKSKSADFLKYKLSDVTVTSVQQSGSEGGEPVDQFSLNYSKIEVSYVTQSATGKVGAPIQAGFDVKTNKKL